VPGPGKRVVAVQSYGDPQGRPVFFFHGWPSSRFQGALADEAARKMGVRFLSVDRPGVGNSDVHVDRRLSDWPEVVAALGDHLGYEKFHVIGVSGGGPYTLASAWALPERVLGATVVSGAPPIADRADTSTLMPVYRFLLGVYRRNPDWVRWAFRIGRGPATVRPPRWFWALLMRAIPPCDRIALDDHETLDRAWAGYAGAWTGHPDGVFHDAAIYAQPWGFDPAEIRVPVNIWHGTEDRNFRPELAKELASRIPHARLHILEGEGHYSLIMRRIGEMLEELVSEGVAANRE